jgi:hypothetical protein
MVAAVVLAAVVRFAGLGSDPLDAAEASQSIAAWWTVEPSSEALSRLAPRPESGLLLGLDAAVFWLTDSPSDLVARWIPALAGTALLLVALVALRAESRLAAVAVVILLAVDPWLVAASRRASGAILGAGAAVACYLLLRRLVTAAPTAALATTVRRQWIWWAVSAGLLLVCGSTAWDFLPPILLVTLVATRGPSRLGSPRPSAGAVLGAAVTAAVLGSTTGLLQWGGPALLSWSLESWLSSWTGSWREMSLATVTHASAAVALYQIALAALAAWGVWRTWNRDQRSGAAGPSPDLALALLVWLTWGAAMQLRSGGGPDVWLALEVPMLLAAALGLEHLLTTLERGNASVGRRIALGAFGALSLAAAVAGISGVPRPAPALPAARLLAGDLLVLLERPASERPRVDVVTGPRIDGVLAWYLREVPARWVASANESPDDPMRVVVVSATLPRDAAHPPSPAYALRAQGDSVSVVELR